MNEIPALTGTPEESIRFIVAGGEILRVDKQGIHYNGQTVADGGAAHDAWMTTMKLMRSASFLGTVIAPQALRKFVEWASVIFERYASLKPDAGDTPEVQEETAESIQRDRAYLSAFVATCEEAQGMQQSALETSTRIDLEENQRKNNVAMDILSAKVDDLRKERDAARHELRSARHVLGVEYDIEERTVAESIGLLKQDRQMEKSHVINLIHEGVEMKAELDALNTAENRRAIGLDMPASSNAEIMRLRRAFDDLKMRYQALRNPASGTIADGGEWSREEAIEMHRRKAEELLKVMIERDAQHERAIRLALDGNSLRQERDALRDTLRPLLAAGKDAMQGALKTLTIERDALRAAQQKSLDGFAALTAERDNLWQHRDAMQIEIEKLTAERDRLKADITGDIADMTLSLTTERDALKAELAALGSACDKLRINENVMRRERDEAIATLHGSAMEMCGSSAFVKLYQETVRERDILRTLLTTDWEALKAQVDTDQTVLLALRQSNRHLTAERDAAKRELAEMSAALDVVLKERAELRLQIDRWRSWPSTTGGEAKA